MLKVAVNGKAVHGTGGVNYLPHMLAFYRVAATVFGSSHYDTAFISGVARERLLCIRLCSHRGRPRALQGKDHEHRERAQ